MKGKVSTGYTVRCGKCEAQHQLDNMSRKSEFHIQIEREGWRKTREYGWICPACRKFLLKTAWSDSANPFFSHR